MHWYVVTKEANGMEGRSSAMSSENTALGFACDLIAASVSVARIEGPNGIEIAAEEVVERCTARKRGRPTRQ